MVVEVAVALFDTTLALASLNLTGCCFDMQAQMISVTKGLQMVGVPASSVVAQVMDIDSPWGKKSLILQDRPSDSVRWGVVLSDSRETSRSIASIICKTAPVPTSCFKVDLKLREESAELLVRHTLEYT
jgi:hypothetical protein